jgi:hypothetical protein
LEVWNQPTDAVQQYEIPYTIWKSHIISQSLKPIACAFSDFLGIILDAICLVFYSSPSESDGHYYFVDAQTLQANYISNLPITCASLQRIPKNWSNLWIHFTPKSKPLYRTGQESRVGAVDLPNFITRLQKKWRKGENNHGTTKSPTAPLVSYKPHHLPVNVHGLWIQRSRSVPPLPTMQVWVVFVVLFYGGHNASCWVKAERKPLPTAAARQKLLDNGFFQRRSIRAPQCPYPSPPISHSVWTNVSYPNS